eukprot:3740075-Pyramimonas_sp.AAC.1
MVAGPIVNGRWGAFAAERLPQAIDDAIEEQRQKSFDAAQQLSPEELHELIPLAFPMPMTHQVRGCALNAQCPVDARQAAGRKNISTRS